MCILSASTSSDSHTSSQCHRHQSDGIGGPKNTFNDCGVLAESLYIIGSRYVHCFAIPWSIVKLPSPPDRCSVAGLTFKGTNKFRCDGRILPLFAQDCSGDLRGRWLSSPRSLFAGVCATRIKSRGSEGRITRLFVKEMDYRLILIYWRTARKS